MSVNGNGSSKRWSFTLNNPKVHDGQGPDDIKRSLRAGKGYKYVVFQLEEGAGGTPHYQGFVTFDGTRRFSALTKMLPGAHLEMAHGSSPANQHYCTKPVLNCGCSHCVPPPKRLAGPWEDGVCPQGSGDRQDLIKLRDAVKSNKRKRDLVEDPELMEVVAKYPRFADLLYQLYPAPRDEAPVVTLMYGPTGCGKTRWVHDNEPSLWTTSIGKGNWYDAYDGEEAALFDDFAGKASHTALTDALRLFDRYRLRVPVKGGFVWWRPKRIYITTNIHPYLWYDWSGREEQYSALRRRFTRVVTWRSDGTDRTEVTADLRLCARFWESFALEARSAPAERVYNPTTREWETRLLSRPGGGPRLYDFLFE